MHCESLLHSDNVWEDKRESVCYVLARIHNVL